jgi:ParB-like chromosome segregation protein Spo0J
VKAHPAADTLPMMAAADLMALGTDIRERGQIHPIVVWRGLIVDGRNRHAACQLVNVAPVFEDRQFTDDADAARFIASQNIHRRHLTTSQRAMIAGRLKPMFEGAAKQRQGSGLSNLTGLARNARDDAASAAGVSPTSTQHALTVLGSDDQDLIDSVDRGNVSVSAAAKRITEERTSTKRVVEVGPMTASSVAREVIDGGSPSVGWRQAAVLLAEALMAYELDA